MSGDNSLKYYKTKKDGKYILKIGTAKSYEEGRAFDFVFCVCLE